MTTITPPTAAPRPPSPTAGGTATGTEQHPLPVSILLHLLPGVALTVFIVLAAPTVRSLGIPAPFTLFLGIPLVIVPFELGYLLLHAKRSTGTFSLRETVTYREKLPRKRLVGWTAALFAWFMVFFLASTLLLDEWLADTLFAWMPEALLQFSTFEDGGQPVGPLVTAALVALAFTMNGIVGPVVEELYFRGHLLPRIERYGRWAPVLNTVLFSLYHLWTPWQNLARIVGLLPMTWATRRHRSVQLSIATHVTVNLVFLLLLFAMLLAPGA